MLKNYFTSCIIAVAVLCLVNCTNKEINLITNIDFELLTDHEDIGFVKDSLITNVILAPQSTDYPGFEYYISYKVTKGKGYFVATDGSVVPEESDIRVHFENDFTTDWHYIGTDAGDHSITIAARDNFNRTKGTSLNYEIKPITLDWEATSPQTMAQANDTIPMQLRLSNTSEGLDLNYTYSVNIAEGAGLVLDSEKNPIAINKALEITEGVYELFFIGAAIGNNILRFDLVASNAIEKTTALNFDIKEELKNEAPIAMPDMAETTAAKVIAIDVLLNDEDPEGDALTITDVTPPANGQAVIENGKILYTPNDTFLGNEPFRYTIMDEAGNEATGDITVVVKMREILAIPDPNFEQALIDLGYDDVIDQKMFKDVAEGITTLNVSNKRITDLTGIEGFVNLEDLSATDNSLTNVDISQNTKLKRLTFKKNQLTALDVTQNLELEFLELWFNEISTIDVSRNIALKFLDIDTNNLETIDLTSNINLEELFLFNNKLTNIDLSKNTELLWLQIGNRTGLPNDNAISTINLKGLTKLGNNQLYNMPALGCIEVDDVSSDLISSWSKDATAYYSEDCSQPRATIAIPDAKFEQALIDLGHDDVIDQKMFKDVAEGITTLDVSNKAIADLTGIEGFVNLEELVVRDNTISEMKITLLTKLIRLDAGFNRILSIDLSGNTELEILNIEQNRLTTLDTKRNLKIKELITRSHGATAGNNEIQNLEVSHLLDLERLICHRNGISTIDLSNNKKLTFFQCGWNPLTSLDLSQNIELIHLNPGGSPVGNIDVSMLTKLETLALWNINMTAIDVSGNPNLKSLAVPSNDITSLDISNIPVNQLVLNARNNPNLSCIQVQDVIAATARTDWQKDATAYYSEDCSQPRATIAIPDPKFEQALIDLGHDDVIDQKMFKDVAEGITTLDVSNKAIADLTGIEGFVNLTELTAINNNLVTVDITKNTKLQRLTFKENQLTALDLSQNIALEWLELWFNEIAAIDVSKNTALKFLDIDTNALLDIDLSSNVNLTELYLFNNRLTEIDLSMLTKLEKLEIGNRTGLPNDNTITTLNFKGLSNLTTNNMRNMSSLTCIEVDDINASNISSWQKDTTAYYSEDCSQPRETIAIPDDNFEQALFDLGYDDTVGDNKIYKDIAIGITTLDISQINENVAESIKIVSAEGIEGFVNLEFFDARYNLINSIDISKNTKLKHFNVEKNEISILDVSNNNNLEFLNFARNPINQIDISMLTKLQKLFGQATNLSAIDLNNNVLLNQINLGITNISNLNLSSLINLKWLGLWKTNLTTLGVSTNIELSFLAVAECDIINLDVSNNIKLEDLQIVNTKLSSINLAKNTALKNLRLDRNALTNVDIKGLNGLTTMNLTVNPNLICIQVDDPQAASTNTNWQKDATASYNTSCP